MKIIQDLLDSIQTDTPIQRLLVGVHWTAVLSRGCGMASTVMSAKPHGEGAVRGAGNLERLSALELAQYALSENTLEASIGLAALNSLIDVPKKKVVEVNAFQFLTEQGAGKTVAVFGHFPNIKALRDSAIRVIVFELTPAEGEYGLGDIPRQLPSADLVAITSNSLINHTLPEILPHIRAGAFTMLLGPSTPLSPVLFDHGLDMLAGVRVTDTRLLFDSVAQGAIFRQVNGVELITITR
jgi:hypothetical protein